MNFSKLLILLIVSASFSAFAKDFSSLNFVYEVAENSDFSMIPSVPNFTRDDNKEQKFFLIKGHLGIMQLDARDDVLEYEWIEPSMLEVRYSSASKTMDIVQLNPQVPLFRLEDFLSIHISPRVYFEYRKLLYDDIKISHDDNGKLTAVFPHALVKVDSSESTTNVYVYSKDDKNLIYKGKISSANDEILVEFQYHSESPKRKYSLKPLPIKDFDFSLISPPLLEDEIVIVDRRVMPAIAYISIGAIPSLEESKKIYDSKFPEDWKKEVSNFLTSRYSIAPKEFNGLKQLREKLAELAKSQ